MNELPQPSVQTERLVEVVVRAGLAAIPTVGGSLLVVADELLSRRRERVRQLAEQVMAGQDPESVLDRLIADERLGELFIRAAEAAEVAPWEPKRRAMGRVVRAALAGDDAEVLEDSLLIDALIDLDEPHFAVLTRLNEQIPGGPPVAVAGVLSSSVLGASEPVVAALVRHGATTGNAGLGGVFVAPTEFDASC
jgi:hypothetical protein